jgi:hypothetical protein
MVKDSLLSMVFQLSVMPLDNSRQFETYHGTSEADFLKALRAISQAVP